MRKATIAGFLTLLVAVGSGHGWAAVNPFYERLLEEGRLAYLRADDATAVERLRLACFGLLDEPALLTDCLIHLALCQAHLDDRAAFLETVQRIVEVDERFQVYAAASVPPAVRGELEAEVAATIPVEYLAASASFRHLAERQDRGPQIAIADLTELKPRRRRSTLRQRIESEPEDFRLHVLLAETELELASPEPAVHSAERALELDPGNQDALCVRGRARAELGACSAAIADLEACRKIYSELEYGAALLGCYRDVGRYAEGRQLLASFSGSLRSARQIRRLARDLDRSPTAGDAEPIASGPPRPAPDLADLETLGQARQMLTAARSAADLERARELAISVADLYPDHRGAQHLAAEIAYRASRWGEAVRYFERGGDPGEEQPQLLFYLAVAYYESGRADAAAETLRRCLPSLQRSSYVDSYVEKILDQAGLAPGMLCSIPSASRIGLRSGPVTGTHS